MFYDQELFQYSLLWVYAHHGTCLSALALSKLECPLPSLLTWIIEHHVV